MFQVCSIVYQDTEGGNGGGGGVIVAIRHTNIPAGNCVRTAVAVKYDVRRVRIANPAVGPLKAVSDSGVLNPNRGPLLPRAVESRHAT